MIPASPSNIQHAAGPSILGLATAVPEHKYAQMDLYDQLMSDIFNSHRAPAIFRATDIDTRYSVIGDPQWLAPNPSAGERNSVYMQEAPKLGANAVQRALNQAGLHADEIDEFIVVSCTGVDCPGLDVHIAADMKMSPHLRRSAIVGMGCHALLPALNNAMAAVQMRPQSKVLVLTLELCTLHLQHTKSLQNIIASALFADGASAAVIGHSDKHPRLLDHMVYTDYSRPEEIAFHPGDTGYHISLSTKVPKILRELLPPVLGKFLKQNKLNLNAIDHWLVHPGGTRILDYVEESLDLSADKLQHSRSVLRNYGNMSSATLLFVLEETLRQENPQPGQYGLLIGFGAGLSLEFVLVQW